MGHFESLAENNMAPATNLRTDDFLTLESGLLLMMENVLYALSCQHVLLLLCPERACTVRLQLPSPAPRITHHRRLHVLEFVSSSQEIGSLCCLTVDLYWALHVTCHTEIGIVLVNLN